MPTTAAMRRDDPARPAIGDYDLTKTALGRLLGFFKAKNHSPSGAQVAALVDIMKTLEDMAEGEADPMFYLSSLDPGVGKSQAIRWFVDALLEEPEHAERGVLILHGRLDEITNFIDDASIPADNLCVRTSDPKINALGKAEADKAQVLITTQQALDLRFKSGQRFDQIDDLFYHGRPRQVRVWDEAFLPGHTITVNVDRLGHLFADFRYKSGDLYEAVVDTFIKARNLKDGDVFTFPDLADQYGVSLNDAIDHLDVARNSEDERCNENMRELITSVYMLSGRTVSARIDGQHGATVLDFEDTVPVDLAPMLICDASGRVRSLYQDMENDRKMIRRLRHGPKSYEPLTVKVWRTGGGKNAFAKGTDSVGRLIEGVAETIATKPDEMWLVVHHQENVKRKVIDTEQAVRDHLDTLGVPSENVSFITWGRHMATNRFGDVPNVILAGTLFYRTSDYEALKRLGSGRKAKDGKVTKAEIKATTAGEHAHQVLQALCRGRVRKSDGDRCQPMTAHVIASVRSGIPDLLPDIFPGCTVERWRPLGLELTGNAARVHDFLADWIENSDQPYLPFSSIYKGLGISQQNFSKNIKDASWFDEVLADLGLTRGANPRGRGRGNKRPWTGVTRVSASDFGFTVKAA